MQFLEPVDTSDSPFICVSTAASDSPSCAKHLVVMFLYVPLKPLQLQVSKEHVASWGWSAYWLAPPPGEQSGTTSLYLLRERQRGKDIIKKKNRVAFGGAGSIVSAGPVCVSVLQSYLGAQWGFLSSGLGSAPVEWRTIPRHNPPPQSSPAAPFHLPAIGWTPAHRGHMHLVYHSARWNGASSIEEWPL